MEYVRSRDTTSGSPAVAYSATPITPSVLLVAVVVVVIGR